MKVVVIEPNADGWPTMEYVPDSAIVKDRKPSFLPESGCQWAIDIYVAVRISRLGKSVAKRFASRYYDAVTLGAKLKPVTEDRWLRSAALGMDGAWIQGEWRPIPEGSVWVDGLPGGRLMTDKEQWQLDDAIASASRLMTLKTGDQLATVRIAADLPVAIGDTLTLAMGGAETLKIKIR